MSLSRTLKVKFSFFVYSMIGFFGATYAKNPIINHIFSADLAALVHKNTVYQRAVVTGARFVPRNSTITLIVLYKRILKPLKA